VPAPPAWARELALQRLDIEFLESPQARASVCVCVCVCVFVCVLSVARYRVHREPPD
jgi:hypothetical protein